MQGQANLTQRELHYIEDCLKSEQLAIKKLQMFGNQTSDPEVSEICMNLANKHLQHYNTLLQHLQSDSQMSVQ